MKSSVTRAFRDEFAALPETVREQAVRAYRLWLNDQSHSSLQFKRIGSREAIYSVRIGLNYRALGLLEGDVIYWYWIGGHAQYDSLLKRVQ